MLFATFASVSQNASAGFFNKEQKIRTEEPIEELTPLYERKIYKSDNKKTQPLAYFWFQPALPYPEGLKFPLVLILHGSSGKSYAGKFLVSPDMQMAYPAFIIVPVLPEKKIWSAGNPDAQGQESIHNAVALVKSLLEQYPVDTRRIYVIGCSDGGTGTFAAATYYPDIFAGAVTFSGSWNPELAPKMTTVPIWAMHGAKDQTIPPKNARDTVTLIHEYGGIAYYTEFPEMSHECPSPQLYSPQMWEWLFRQSK